MRVRLDGATRWRNRSHCPELSILRLRVGNLYAVSLNGTSREILVPFFGDVDTRVGNVVTYDATMLAGKNVFGVNWIDVGCFSQQTNKLNSFQLIITERSDIAAGDFDFDFNSDQIQWETGGASGGVNGLGGSSARMGWSNGAPTPTSRPDRRSTAPSSTAARTR